MEKIGTKLTRKEIINNWKWREGMIPLLLSNHAKRRVEERMLGEFIIVPTVCRITKNNICSGRTLDGKKLSNIKIRLEYTKDKWLYLVICPGNGVVKTLYINYKDDKKNAPFERDKTVKKGEGTEEECCEDEGAIITGTAGEGWNEGIVLRDLEEERSSFRNFWGIFGKRAS